VLRGGAWDYNALSCRSAFHDYYSHPVYYYLDFGFRSVLP
jgi:formylglycine-generating enzyme required for sulfatase activity